MAKRLSKAKAEERYAQAELSYLWHKVTRLSNDARDLAEAITRVCEKLGVPYEPFDETSAEFFQRRNLRVVKSRRLAGIKERAA